MFLLKPFHSLKIVVLFVFFCFLNEAINAQSPFSYYYRDSFGSNNLHFYNVNILSNQDILHTQGAVYSGGQIMRTDANGMPIWYKSLWGYYDIMNAVNESSSGNMLLTTAFQDTLSGNYTPAFILIDSNGNLVNAKYYPVDTTNAYILSATVTSTGRSAALFYRFYPVRYGIISVDDQGQNPWCRIYQSTGATGRFDLMPGTNGSLILTFSDHQDNLFVRKISASGNIIWEKQYAINGNSDDIELNDAVRLSDNLYAMALVIKQPFQPYKVVVLYIDDQGSVLSAHEYYDGLSQEPGCKIYRLDNTEAILSIGHMDTIPIYEKLAIIDSSGSVIRALPYDTIWQKDIQPLDSLNYYVNNGSFQTFQLKNIHQATRSCEVIDTIYHLPATASSTPVTSVVQTYNAVASSYTPTITDRIVYAFPACSNVSLADDSGIEKVIIFPNPTNLEKIKINGLPSGNWHYTLTDMSGIIIHADKVPANFAINLKNISHGIYILTFESGAKIIRQKLIRQ